MTAPLNYSEEGAAAIPTQEQTQPMGTLPVTPRPVEIDDNAQKSPDEQSAPMTFWGQWFDALKQTWHIYFATHIAAFLLTYMSTLFSIDNFNPRYFGLRSLLTAWNRWDTSQFTAIATGGYDAIWRTAFFPLYPLLERGLSVLTFGDPFIAGLIISNLATLVLFMVLYRLIKEDFEHALAVRTVLYMAIFPSALFLIAAYNESIFLCLTLISFYAMRRGSWWVAGLFGLLAALTRSAGLLLLVPFCYEYARQHEFKLSKLRFSVVSLGLVPLGVAIFAVYCYLHLHDLLAFSHAQAVWGRALHLPGMAFYYELKILHHAHILSFDGIHGVIDTGAALGMLVLVCLCFVGPWRFAREHWSYAVYAAALYLFLIMFPSVQAPVQSMARQMIEVFPGLIILALLGRKSTFNFYYIVLAGALLCFMTLQFLTGHWIV